MTRRELFIGVCLATDAAGAIGEMKDAELRDFSGYLDDVGHCEGCVGMFGSQVVLEKARRWNAFVAGGDGTSTLPGNTVAEGMESGLRGEDFT